MDRQRVIEAGAAQDHRAHDQVVGERGVDAAERVDELADRGDVGLEVAVELVVGELGEGLDLEALVASWTKTGSRPPMSGVWTVTEPEAPAPSSGGSRSWQTTWTSCPSRASAVARLAL